MFQILPIFNVKIKIIAIHIWLCRGVNSRVIMEGRQSGGTFTKHMGENLISLIKKVVQDIHDKDEEEEARYNV